VHLIRVTRSTLIRHAKDGIGGRRRETSFYLFSTDISAKKAAGVIRSHRAVENRNHHVRDVAMQEDACRIRINPGIFARARKFALNILRANHENNIANARCYNTLDIKPVLQYRFK
jgi:predicted transposase YbfD/YdcC